MGQDKEQIAFRVTPQMKREIDLFMDSDGSRTRNEFLEHAVRFYIDHQLAQSMTTLPVSVTSAIDGRLGMQEDQLSILQFNNLVDLDLFPWKRPRATDTASSSSATASIPRPRHAGHLVTAQEDKKLHGYGLKSVYNTLKKYHGDYG